MNKIIISSLDGKKSIEFDVDEIVIAILKKKDYIVQKKIIKVTDKNKLVMT